LTNITGEVLQNSASVGGGIYSVSPNDDVLGTVIVDRNSAICYGKNYASEINNIQWSSPPPSGVAPDIDYFSLNTKLLDYFGQQVQCIKKYYEIKLTSSTGSTLLGEILRVRFFSFRFSDHNHNHNYK
jgi:hypothetical protein